MKLLIEGLVLWLLASPKRQGFADHVLQVDTGKREDAVY